MNCSSPDAAALQPIQHSSEERVLEAVVQRHVGGWAHHDQRAELGAFIVPEHAIDAQSLVAYADLVISAGGTMNREAVALGTPVFTTFEGRLGAVDEALMKEGRLHKLEDPGQIQISRRPANAGLRVRRDPRQLVTMLLAARQP